MTSTSLSSSSLLSSSSSSSSALNTDEPIEPSSSLVAPSTPLGVLSALRSQLEQLERDRESLIAGESTIEGVYEDLFTYHEMCHSSDPSFFFNFYQERLESIQKGVLCLRVYEQMRWLEQLPNGVTKLKLLREHLPSRNMLQYQRAQQLAES